MLRKVLAALLVLTLIVTVIGCGGDETSPTQTGETVTLKLASSAASDAMFGLVYQHFADLVEDYTDGRVLIDIYPGSQLFPASEQWEALVSGTIDIFADSSYYLSTYVPDVMVFYMDGFWESYEHAYAVMEESELPQILTEKIEAAGPVKMLGFFPGSMPLCVLNKVRETKTLADLDGLKTQGIPGSPSTAVYDYTGMSSIPIAYEEVVAAFMQGVIDAVHYPPFVLVDLRLYETGEHMLCRTALYANFGIVMNGEAWDSLPADVQDTIVNQVIPETYAFGKSQSQESEEEALDLIADNVETVNWVTQEDIEPYLEYARTHSVTKVQLLMVEPRIMEIIEEYKPSAQ
jgi:TRAP-type C4-dicarboxylate transport system substrate-binding protein